MGGMLVVVVKERVVVYMTQQWMKQPKYIFIIFLLVAKCKIQPKQYNKFHI